MADRVLSFTIPGAKIDTAMEGFLMIYPNTEMTDDEPPVNKYTDEQWIKEKIRRNIIRDIRRGLITIEQGNISVPYDNEIVT